MGTQGEKARIRLRARVQTVVKGSELVLLKKGALAKVSPWSPALRRCLELWREGGTRDEFVAKLSGDHPSAWEAYAQQYDRLVEEGFFEEIKEPENLLPVDAERWARTIDFFSEFEEEGGVTRFERMEKLRNAKVLVVGLGGMGSWVMYQLLSLGIGNIHLVDGDKVELANLNRAILYSPDDVGDWKVDGAIRAAKRFAPTTKVEGTRKFLASSADLLPLLDGVDMVIGCADQPIWLIRQWITEACLEANVPFIMAGGGKVGPLTLPGESACPMCTWTTLVEQRPGFAEMVALQRELPRGHSGGLSAVAAMVATTMVMEVFRFISGYSQPLTVNAVWELGPDLTSKIVPLPRHPHCCSCAPQNAHVANVVNS